MAGTESTSPLRVGRAEARRGHGWVLQPRGRAQTPREAKIMEIRKNMLSGRLRTMLVGAVAGGLVVFCRLATAASEGPCAVPAVDCGQDGEYYNGRWKSLDGPFTGAKATIETYQGKRCTGTTTPPSVWVGVMIPLGPKWVQTGYEITSEGTTYYCEFNLGGWCVAGYYGLGTASGTQDYKVEFVGSHWEVHYAGHLRRGPDFCDVCEMTRADYNAEMHKAENQCPGDIGDTSASYCTLSGCKYKNAFEENGSKWHFCPGPGGWEEKNFLSQKWGQAVDGATLDIWDKRCP